MYMISSSSTLSMINLNLNQLFPFHSILTDESDEVKLYKIEENKKITMLRSNQYTLKELGINYILIKHFIHI